MQVRGDRIILDAGEQALLELACRGDFRPQLTCGDFARWLHKPRGDDMLALAYGARLFLGDAFEKARAATLTIASVDAGGRLPRWLCQASRRSRSFSVWSACGGLNFDTWQACRAARSQRFS
jgi:hypothetical protein